MPNTCTVRADGAGNVDTQPLHFLHRCSLSPPCLLSADVTKRLHLHFARGWAERGRFDSKRGSDNKSGVLNTSL
jgi:hypothetical protein